MNIQTLSIQFFGKMVITTIIMFVFISPLKHYSYRAEQAYIFWIKRFIFYFKKRHPQEMGEKEINEFLTHLAVNDKIFSSSQIHFLLLFFLKKHLLVWEKTIVELIDFGEGEAYNLSLKRMTKKDSIFF